MTLIVPNVAEVLAVNQFLDTDLTMKLYSNDVTPAEANTLATYNEVAGGGYVAKTLYNGTWVITPGNPTIAVYPVQDFLFTGPTDTPSTCYGYFVVDSDGILRWAERFPEGALPFMPILGSLVRIRPRFVAS